MQQFKAGDIVWVNLGFSYGWWPGEFSKKSENVKCPSVEFSNERPENLPEKTGPIPIAQVRFFDDDKFDLLNVFDAANLKPYSCEGKETLILEGLDKFSQKKTSKDDSMFGFGARQAQFYKDVEMAEVLTDNSPSVAEILAKYEVVEDTESSQHAAPPKKKRRRKAR